MDMIYKHLCDMVGDENVSLDEDMSRHVTFRAGGRAKYFVQPDDTLQLMEVLKFLKSNSLKYYIMGNGSNLLVKDDGFDGVIVKIGNKFGTIEMDTEKNQIYCGAGALLAKIASIACDHSLTGMEFAAGIPGMVGGAVAMNAGAYGGEMLDIIDKVWVIDENCNEQCLTCEKLEFGYRTSIIQNKDYIVTAANLQLERGIKSDIVTKMNELLSARKEKQPLEYPSAGSTFKRPEGYFAGKLIMDAGLRGFHVGGAKVSEKHCGFVINSGNATAGDIIMLMEQVTKIVYDKFGVKLEPEVKII
ncbi:MAG: UDP-N-acetylmuramate dehydrogenase [Lachnospiraceae bacterium]|nr:UDP-N-acetylmuramate dehydrogenase [Lachnospiraceae bacterium]